MSASARHGPRREPTAGSFAAGAPSARRTTAPRDRAAGQPPRWLDPVLTLGERIDRRRRRIRAIRADGVLGIELARYRDRPIVLRDGTRVSPGDRIAVLHLRNERVRALTRRGWQTPGWRAARLDLEALAAWWWSRPPGARPIAARATTILGVLGRREGWEIRPRPRWWRAGIDDWFMRWLLVHWRGSAPARGSATARGGPVGLPEAVDVWLSGAELLARYGPGRAGTGRPPGPAGGARPRSMRVDSRLARP